MSSSALTDLISLLDGPTSPCRRATVTIRGREVRVPCRNRGCRNGCARVWIHERLGDFDAVVLDDVFDELSLTIASVHERDALVQRLRRAHRAHRLLGWWTAPVTEGHIFISDGLDLGGNWARVSVAHARGAVRQAATEITEAAREGERPGNVRLGGEWYDMVRHPARFIERASLQMSSR